MLKSTFILLLLFQQCTLKGKTYEDLQGLIDHNDIKGLEKALNEGH